MHKNGFHTNVGASPLRVARTRRKQSLVREIRELRRLLTRMLEVARQPIIGRIESVGHVENLILSHSGPDDALPTLVQAPENRVLPGNAPSHHSTQQEAEVAAGIQAGTAITSQSDARATPIPCVQAGNWSPRLRLVEKAALASATITPTNVKALARKAGYHANTYFSGAITNLCRLRLLTRDPDGLVLNEKGQQYLQQLKGVEHG